MVLLYHTTLKTTVLRFLQIKYTSTTPTAAAAAIAPTVTATMVPAKAPVENNNNNSKGESQKTIPPLREDVLPDSELGLVVAAKQTLSDNYIHSGRVGYTYNF